MNTILEDIKQIIGDMVQDDELSNDELVQIIEHCGMYLNLKTVSDFAKDNEMSYNGVKKFRNVVKIFNVKFVIENE
jgi:hypothetical protein